jgi:AcrR family transcriptional regulator
MPPKKRIFREDILSASADLVREEGPQALSVRNIAGKLNCSTQPIYSEFENMETLREELMTYVKEKYLRENAESYKQVALSFLHFAQREKNLFQLIYLRPRTTAETFFEDPNAAETIRKLETSLELPQEQAAEMHRRMQYYCYSMAVMMATCYLQFTEKEINEELTEYYRIILSYYKHVKNEEELQHWLHRSRNLLV